MMATTTTKASKTEFGYLELSRPREGIIPKIYRHFGLSPLKKFARSAAGSVLWDHSTGVLYIRDISRTNNFHVVKEMWFFKTNPSSVYIFRVRRRWKNNM